MFYDEVRVSLKAGKGGDGCMSFRREKYIPFGGPDGGNGGKGGDVLIRGDENVGDLRTFHFKPGWKAQTGEGGKGKKMVGRSGKDCLLKLPLGSLVINEITGEVLAEITVHGQEQILLQGGGGGRGNSTFKSSINQAPRQTTEGKAGEEHDFKFILKTIADIGLVGFPNAGKSSLTRLITTATPKIGSYPFTTLNPSVGIVDYPDLFDQLKLADIPGIIDGASENRGLGIRFLKHIERCSVLLLILDMAGIDGRSPVDDYDQLIHELGNYKKDLLSKKIFVAANKMDEPEATENLKTFKRLKPEVLIQPVSCLTEEGLEELKNLFYKECKA